MAEAPRAHRKMLLAVRNGGVPPGYVTTDDLQSQAEYVCNEVLRRRESGVDLRRQAVLFRNSSASDVLEIELMRRKIPFLKYGGLQFLEAAHIKDLLGLLRWADNPRNGLAAFRSLQLLNGMGPVNARKALEFMEQHGGGAAALAGFSAPQVDRPELARLVQLLTGLQDPARPWEGQVQQARRWYEPQLERLYQQQHTRVGDLDQLEQLATGYPSRERFLTELTLDPPQASGDLAGAPHKDEDYLVLSTVHSAKGMEWDTVFLLNVVDGSFPSEFATGRAEQIDEERRLLYVAMTRARNELQLCVPLKFMLTQQPRDADGHVYGGRSRFISDKVLKCFSQSSFQGTRHADAGLSGEIPVDMDIGGALQKMW
jgi:DNA helicase-2/ATP-dependent DNA helicase PcrA